MRTRYRYDADLDCLVPIGGNFFEEAPQGPSVISDDVGFGVNGLKHMPTSKMLDSKSAFREADRRSGVECVGNEQNFESKPDATPKGYYEREAQVAREMLSSNHNGMADRVRRENEITRYRREHQR